MEKLPPTEDLDVRGLKCPLPAMLARKALARLPPGTRLTVLADDPMALVDMPYMCHREGHTLESTDEQPAHAAFHIRAKTGPALTPEIRGSAEAAAAQGAQDDPHLPDPQGGSPQGQGA